MVKPLRHAVRSSESRSEIPNVQDTTRLMVPTGGISSVMWQGEYIGVLICANAARSAFEEVDFRAMHTFANLAAALWVAHDGPGWLRTIDYAKLPVRREGT